VRRRRDRAAGQQLVEEVRLLGGEPRTEAGDQEVAAADHALDRHPQEALAGTTLLVSLSEVE